MIAPASDWATTSLLGVGSTLALPEALTLSQVAQWLLLLQIYLDLLPRLQSVAMDPLPLRPGLTGTPLPWLVCPPRLITEGAKQLHKVSSQSWFWTELGSGGGDVNGTRLDAQDRKPLYNTTVEWLPWASCQMVLDVDSAIP